MKTGAIKEHKQYEYRFGIITSNMKEYIQNDHQVFVEINTGEVFGFLIWKNIEVKGTILTTMEEI